MRGAQPCLCFGRVVVCVRARVRARARPFSYPALTVPSCFPLLLSLNPGAEGAEAISDLLHSNTSVVKLYMSGSNLGPTGAVALAQALTAIGQAHDTTVHWSHSTDQSRGEAEAAAVAGAQTQETGDPADTNQHASPPALVGAGAGTGAGTGAAAEPGEGGVRGGAEALAMGRNTSDVSALAAASGRMTIQPDHPSNPKSPSLSPTTPFSSGKAAASAAATSGSVASSAAGGGVGTRQHQRPPSLEQGAFGDLNYHDFDESRSGNGNGNGGGGGGGGGASSVKWVSWLYISDNKIGDAGLEAMSNALQVGNQMKPPTPPCAAGCLPLRSTPPRPTVPDFVSLPLLFRTFCSVAVSPWSSYPRDWFQ